MRNAKKILRLFRGTIYYVVLNYLKLISRFNLTGLKIVNISIKNKSFSMIVDLDDKGLSNDIYFFRIREYPNVEYYANFLEINHEKIDTVIDLGANIGYYVLLENTFLKDIKRKKYKLIAIEPVKENLDLLKKNIKINLFENIIVAQNAVGDKDKEIEIVVSEHKNHSRIIGVGKKNIDSDKKQIVQMQTLPALFKFHNIPKKNVLIRMDIEGYEYNLLMSNKKFIKKVKNFFIVFEYHPFFLSIDKNIEFLKFLKDAGFELQQVISCEPPYFLHTPHFVRKLLNKAWLTEYNGEKLGKLKNYKNFEQLIEGVKKKNSSIYNYPNLHLYLHKK